MSTYRGKGLTPYQGTNRVFGEFRCSSCSRSWMSGNSWADMGQMCTRCNINVYPHTQTALKLSRDHNKSDMTKAHLESLCEKCKKLGYSCRKGQSGYY